MNKSSPSNGNKSSSSRRRIVKKASSKRILYTNSLSHNKIENKTEKSNQIEASSCSGINNTNNNANTFPVNCDNKINHCNRYDVSNGLFSGHHGKSSIDDESSHRMNASNTNNKSERKRNINMLNENCSGVSGDVIVSSGNTKRMKVDCDGQDNNKSKMYQVSIKQEQKKKKNERKKFLFSDLTLRLLSHSHCVCVYMSIYIRSRVGELRDEISYCIYSFGSILDDERVV